jgi:hypothetical protein
MAEKEPKKPDVSAFEGEGDDFEEFAADVPEQPTVEEEGKDLWEADWDDEDTTEDFQQKLKQELGRHMKD